MGADPDVTTRAPLRRTAALDAAGRRLLADPGWRAGAASDDAGSRGLPLRRMAAVLLLAAPVHLAAPAILVTAGWVLASADGPLAVLLAVALLLVAVGSWPRRARRLDPAASLTAQEAPVTFALLDRVTAQVGAPRLHRLDLTPGLGSRVHRSGLLRRPVLEVGAVGWVALSDRGRVAMVAHEAVHLVLPELRWERSTGRAEAVLEEWRLIAGGEHPRRGGDAEDARRFVTSVSAVLLAPVRVVVVLWSRSLLRLQAPVTVQGELVADGLAARAAGVDALHEVWDLGLGAATWETALTRGLSGHEDLLSCLRDAVAAVPAEAVVRRRRSAAEAGHRVDPDHPATDLRRVALDRLALAGPLVVVTGTESRTSEVELGTALAGALRDAAQALRYAAPGSSLGQRSADAVRRQVRAQSDLDTAGS